MFNKKYSEYQLSKRTEHTTRCLGAYLYCSAVVSKLLSVNPTGCTFRRVNVLRATCIGSNTNMPITTNGEHMVIAMLVTTSFIITTPTMKYMQRFSVKNFLRQIVNGSMPVSFIVNWLLQMTCTMLPLLLYRRSMEFWWVWLRIYHLLDGVRTRRMTKSARSTSDNRVIHRFELLVFSTFIPAAISQSHLIYLFTLTTISQLTAHIVLYTTVHLLLSLCCWSCMTII